MDETDPTAMFERMYAAAAAGGDALPWDRAGPHPLLADWARGRDGARRRALVVGSGLGGDAAFLAGLGYDVVGFDASPTAVETARRRHPQSAVALRVADLLDPPPEWRDAFELVLESLTVQSLPVRLHAAAIASVAAMVAPGGTLLVIAHARDDATEAPARPPFPLTRAEIDSFAQRGLETVAIEDLQEPGGPRRWRAELRRPPGSPGAVTIRTALPAERAALEALQRAPTGGERDGAVAGFAIVLACAGGACELDAIFVEPGAMGGGIGRRLVEDAAAIARRRGADRIEVVANPDAAAFYERLGFVAGEPVATRFGPARRMRLALDATAPAG